MVGKLSVPTIRRPGGIHLILPFEQVESSRRRNLESNRRSGDEQRSTVALLQSRIHSHSDRGSLEKDRLLEQVSRLTGRCEQLENDVKNMEARGQATATEMERMAIMAKDKEKRVQQLTREVSKQSQILKVKL